MRRRRPHLADEAERPCSVVPLEPYPISGDVLENVEEDARVEASGEGGGREGVLGAVRAAHFALIW